MQKFKIGDTVGSDCINDPMRIGIVSKILSDDFIQVTPVVMKASWGVESVTGYIRYRQNMLFRVSAAFPETIIYNTLVYSKYYTVAIDSMTGIKGVAVCNPSDMNDIRIGVDIALTRLKENLSTFEPHLCSTWNTRLNNLKLNILGADTNFVDIEGNHLRIGDTVLLFSPDKELCGEKVIHYSTIYDHPIVDGIAMVCGADGIIAEGWKILLKRKYEEIPDGTIIGSFMYVKEDKQYEK